MKNKVEGINLITIINEMFLGYINRKHTGILYEENQELPKQLIRLYYQLDKKDRHLDELKENFINHYIECECILEDTHMKYEQDGLREMYNYIHSEEINQGFDIYTLLELHKKLYSKAPYPSVGGEIRNASAYLKGAAIDLSPHYTIRQELKELDEELKQLTQISKEVQKDPDKIFNYINRCVILKCKLIKIHPFQDGNGRTIRGFLNKMFLNASLPSIYIYTCETEKYKKAMNQALAEDDYTSIIDFYYYKICDSIFELDIKPKVYKKLPIPNQILELATKCKSEIKKQQIDQNEWDSTLIYALEKYLTENQIKCEIHTTTNYDQNLSSHSFIIIYYKNKDINKRLLLDPMFEKLYQEDKLETKNQTQYTKTTFENLLENGVTLISHTNIQSYTNFFKPAKKRSKQLKKYQQ